MLIPPPIPCALLSTKGRIVSNYSWSCPDEDFILNEFYPLLLTGVIIYADLFPFNSFSSILSNYLPPIMAFSGDLPANFTPPIGNNNYETLLLTTFLSSSVNIKFKSLYISELQPGGVSVYTSNSSYSFLDLDSIFNVGPLLSMSALEGFGNGGNATVCYCLNLLVCYLSLDRFQLP